MRRVISKCFLKGDFPLQLSSFSPGILQEKKKKRQNKECKEQLETLCFTINPHTGKDKFLLEFIKQLGTGLRFTQPPFPTSKFFLPGYESPGKLELNLFSQRGQDLCLLSPKMLKV